MDLPRPGLSARLFVAAQHLLPQHFLAGIVYRLARSQTPVVKNLLIRSFVRVYQPNLSEADQSDPLQYPTFNAFFTRALRPRVRPIDPNPSTLVSPVDGIVSQIGALEADRILQAKGHSYSLASLLGAPTQSVARDVATLDTTGAAYIRASTEADADAAASAAAVADAALFWTERFVGGAFTTLYLAPANYHRIHMPLSGTLRAAWYLPGKLFSVNATTARGVPDLFARNERIVCIFENGAMSFGVILIGALFVGSMQTAWHGEVTPQKPRQHLAVPLQIPTPSGLTKGAEMGRFNMGSTVIMLLPRQTLDWAVALQPESTVRVGQPLAQLRARVMLDSG